MRKRKRERDIETENKIDAIFQQKLNQAHIENTPDAAVIVEMKRIVDVYGGKVKRKQWWKAHSARNSYIEIYHKRSMHS